MILTALICVVFLAIVLGAAMAAFRFGCIYALNKQCLPLARPENIRLSLREFLGQERFYSQVGQDRYVLRAFFLDKRDGFFVELGSNDGTEGSNSRAFEERGWSGLCIDPFPKNMSDRTCRIFTEVVDAETGRMVEFRVADGHGGIEAYLDRHKESAARYRTVGFKTTTLNEIFQRADTPSVIDFMSIDIEGAELAALRGLSFERYKVNVFALEHNYEEPKRSELRAFLESKGYLFHASILQDDIYIHPEVNSAYIALWGAR